HAGEARRTRHKERGRSSSRRRKATWKKLLWVKQSYADNYTDEETFLDHLQRNPRLQPYEFWPLVADSTVIVQHVCSVAIFVCCFSAIFTERVSPVSVVGTGTIGTVLGWALWDFWVGQDEAAAAKAAAGAAEAADGSSSAGSAGSAASADALRARDHAAVGLGVTGLAGGLAAPALAPAGGPSQGAGAGPGPGTGPGIYTLAGNAAPYCAEPALSSSSSSSSSSPSLSPRHQQRLATVKSAVIIVMGLLGLSPITKSLTKSWASDSIWAMTCCLLCMNVALFDYSGGIGTKFPAPLATNAAVMASTVLASRLPSTTHVFSLTLFSIEVFALFPVFRRHLRHVSWRGHLGLTVVLVGAAAGATGATVSGGRWRAALAGVVLGAPLAMLGMGACSWWLIGLQKYKNEIHGPWDPARPVIRRRWD
ncbi:phosphatidylinositol N-acetylglucosaminyltransferase subunit C, partial [Lineolata rhizophorae]